MNDEESGYNGVQTDTRKLIVNILVRTNKEKELDLFDYADEKLTRILSQIIHANDKTLKKNPLPLSADNRRWTVFYVAASKTDRKKCLEMLLKYSASVLLDLNVETHTWQTALYITYENDWQGYTPSHLVVMYDSFEVCQILLKNGASVCLTYSDRNLSLHFHAISMYFGCS
ncbi:hypothetical protein PGB90_005808 [Kerria lacca]